jgi:hypothetical protein
MQYIVPHLHAHMRRMLRKATIPTTSARNHYFKIYRNNNVNNNIDTNEAARRRPPRTRARVTYNHTGSQSGSGRFGRRRQEGEEGVQLQFLRPKHAAAKKEKKTHKINTTSLRSPAACGAREPLTITRVHARRFENKLQQVLCSIRKKQNFKQAKAKGRARKKARSKHKKYLW